MNGPKPIFHLVFGGLLNMGIPHCLIAVAQKSVSTASVQLMQPIATTAGAIFGHFILDDERFTMKKFYSLLLSLVGVTLTGIPNFAHAGSNPNTTIGAMAIGYVLLFVSVVMFGVAPGYFKWTVPNADITLSATIQIFASAIFNFFYSLINDGWDKMVDMTMKAPSNAWLWPMIIGCLVSGSAIHGFMYLINEIGTFGANMIPFGQIIFGVGIGVFFLKEWEKFSLFEVILSLCGIGFLVLSLAFGFGDVNQNDQPEEDIPEEEEDNYDRKLQEL